LLNNAVQKLLQQDKQLKHNVLLQLKLANKQKLPLQQLHKL